MLVKLVSKASSSANATQTFVGAFQIPACRTASLLTCCGFHSAAPEHQEFSNSLQPGLRLVNRQVETHKPSSRPPQVKESAAPYIFVFLPKCSGAIHHYRAGREQTRAVKVTSVGGDWLRSRASLEILLNCPVTRQLDAGGGTAVYTHLTRKPAVHTSSQIPVYQEKLVVTV